MTETSTTVFRRAEDTLWSELGVERRERFLDLAEPRVRVRVQETGSGPPLLFVHGVFGGGFAWSPLAARLPNVNSILVDRPGCGLSDPWELSGPQFRREAVAVVGSVLDALGVSDVTLVGQSLGALIATWFALDRPKRVRRLVLIGPSAGFPGVRVPIFLRLMSIRGIGERMQKNQRPSPESFRRILVRMGHGESFEAGRIPPTLIECMVAMTKHTRTQGEELRLVQRAIGLGGMQPWARIRERDLEAIALPTLIVAGEHDTHGGVPLARKAASLVPGARLEILSGAGHLLWFDDPGFVANAIMRFCGGDTSIDASVQDTIA
jgi:pimeloyl-ACP methyl ester carboxylesterase